MSEASQAPGTARRQPRGVIVLLALAILAAALSVWASQRASAVQGPSTLGVLPDGAVWLVVDDALWGLSPAGEREQRVPVANTGLHRPPAVLTYRRSTQELYAVARGSARVAVLHPRTGTAIRHVMLAWPDALRDALNGAVWLAVHDDGRMAVATGNGHTVLLFSADGALLAQSKPGMYRYTNDLWWEGAALWTTDTNGHALVRLDGNTLAEQQRLALDDSAAQRYTALAEPHPHAGVARQAPRATVARLDGRMDTGRVVQVWDDGREDNLDLGDQARPLDLGWSADTLLVVEGRDWRVRRFDTLNQPMPDFGDAAVRQELAALKASVARWRMAHHIGLWGAVSALVASVLWLAWHAHRTVPAAEATRLATRFLGTPILPTPQWLKQALVVFAPFIGLVAWMVVLRVVMSPVGLGRMNSRPLAMTVIGVGVTTMLVLGLLSTRWLQRQARRPDAEAVLNIVPVRWLMRSDDWGRVAAPGEHVRETWLLRHLWRPRWVIMSNQRLLVFTARARARKLVAEYPRREVVRVSLRDGHTLRWWQRIARQAQLGCVMRIELRDGTVLEGGVASRVLAQRVQAQLILLKKPERPTPDTAHPMEAAG